MGYSGRPLEKCGGRFWVRAFFDALWPLDVEGNLTFWFAPSRKSAHLPLSVVRELTDEDIEDLHKENRHGASIYHGLGLRRTGLPISKQGGKQDIVALPGLSIDIDIWHPTAHVAQNLPRTDVEAYQIIEPFMPPSLIVHTGHGWQPYWLFDEPLLLTTASQRTQAQKAFRAFQQPFIDRAAELGWHMDNTASIQRVWRVPGFINPKSGAPVELVQDDSDSIRYTAFELSVVITAPDKEPSPTTKKAKKKKVEHTGIPAEFLAALKSLSKDNRNKDLIEKVLAGESFADEERDTAMQRVCSTMAWLPEARELSAETIAEVLRPSLSVWVAEDDNPKWRPLDEEMAKAIDKIERAKQDKEDYEERRHEALGGLRSSLRIGDGAKAIDDDTDNTLVLRHAIIQFRSSFYVYNFDTNKYVGPKIEKELLTYAHQAWENGPPGVELDYYNAKGELKRKAVPQVLHEYAMCADEVIGHFGLVESYYHVETNTFHESVAPIRTDLVPTYDERVAHWLSLLGGDHLDKLLDWLAAFPQLAHQCCALYLDGVSGAGKGMLSEGLSRIFHQAGPVALEDTLDAFNADMFKCPLLFLDEGVSKQRGNISAQLRSLIGKSSQNYKQKNVANRPVLGAVRLLIAANNDNVLAFGDENMSANDLQAYIERFLHIPVGKAASEWLEVNDTTGWVDDGIIARHVLWLAENREIVPGKRFLVEGVSMDSIHRKMITQGDVAGPSLEWLTRFLSNPQELYKTYKIKNELPKALVGNNEVLVNAQALLDHWNVYIQKDTPRPKTNRVGHVLAKISEGTTKRGPRGTRITYHQVRFDLVLGWAIDNQIGDEDIMKENYSNEIA